MAWLGSFFARKRAGSATEPERGDPALRERVAEIIAGHAHSRRLPLLADLPPGESDILGHYLKQLRGSPADEFEARFLVWLGVTFDVEPVFATGVNAGYWTFDYGEGRVALGVVGAGKNTVSRQLADDIAWRLRIEETLPAPFIERIKQEFTPDNPVLRRLSPEVIRIQFNAKGLRRGGSLARALAPGG